MVRSQLPAQEQVGCDPEDEEDDDEGDYVDGVVGMQHVQLLQRGLRGLEVAILGGAVQFGPVEAVCCKSGSFETVSDVGEVRDPSQVDGNCVERHEEAGEEQEGH